MSGLHGQMRGKHVLRGRPGTAPEPASVAAPEMNPSADHCDARLGRADDHAGKRGDLESADRGEYAERVEIARVR